MLKSDRTTTLPTMNSGIHQEGPKAWQAIYELDENGKQIKNAVPIDWICPYHDGGVLLHGSKSCPRCGRVPMGKDRKRLDGYQSMDTGRELKAWRKFGKMGRC